MKKWMLVWVMLFGCASVFYAKDIDLSAIQDLIKESLPKPKKLETYLPQGFNDQEQQTAFYKYLDESIRVIEDRLGIFPQDKEIVDRYVISSIEFALQVRIEGKDDRERLSEKWRSVKYAMFMLMLNGPEKEKYAKYESYIGYTPEYLEFYSVHDWPAYARDCRVSMQTFYDLVKELAEASENKDLDTYLYDRVEWVSIWN